MFRLKSLVCCGCEKVGSENSFFDNDAKRPLFIKCGHPLCSECEEKKYKNCPVCEKKIEKSENFAARIIVEEFKRNPLIDDPEPCSNCFQNQGKVFICITCELAMKHLYLEYVPISEDGGKLYEDFGQKELEKRREEEEHMRRKHHRNTNPYLRAFNFRNDKSLRPRFRMDFNIMSNSVICSDCVLDYHDGHVRKTIWEMGYTTQMLKQSSSYIATQFIWNEIMSKKGKCLIGIMRLQRACEKLKMFVTFNYPNPNANVTIVDQHDRIPTNLNKFFESFGRKEILQLSMDRCDPWIKSLDFQLKDLENQRSCSCQTVWHEMHQFHFGNQIEKKFVEVIEQLETTDFIECPFQLEELSKIRKKAIEMNKTKLFKIYTAFCWNHKREAVCCLFDNNKRKPCKCSKCGAATCLECAQEDFFFKCSSCGEHLFDQAFHSVKKYEIDNGTIELVDFYKSSCVDLLEEWWSCKASQLEFCLSCYSYSDKLEVCVYCEMVLKRKNVLKTRPRIEESVQFRKNKRAYFKCSGLDKFPIRWQCSDCEKRLQANWIHKYCGDHSQNQWIGEWNRGCNHLLTRVYDTKKCSSYEENADLCEYNAINLRDIGHYEIAMKVATSGLVFKILKTGIEEKVKCQMKRIKILNVYGLLKSKTSYYHRRSMRTERRQEDLSLVAAEVMELIEVLKKYWNALEQKECSCIKLWQESSYLSRKEMKNISKVNEMIDKCPLDIGLRVQQDVADCSDIDFHFVW